MRKPTADLRARALRRPRTRRASRPGRTGAALAEFGPDELLGVVEESPRLIVCDTGPLLHLHEARLLNLLPLAGRVLVPPAVLEEVLSVDPIPDWVEVRALDKTFAEEARAWIQAGLLHAGEAYALGLAKQVAANWFLTDDTADPRPRRRSMVFETRRCGSPRACSRMPATHSMSC